MTRGDAPDPVSPAGALPPLFAGPRSTGLHTQPLKEQLRINQDMRLWAAWRIFARELRERVVSDLARAINGAAHGPERNMRGCGDYESDEGEEPVSDPRCIPIPRAA